MMKTCVGELIRKSARNLNKNLRHFNVKTRHCQESIMMGQYGLFAPSCDCANMEQVKWEILPSVNDKFTRCVIIQGIGITRVSSCI